MMTRCAAAIATLLIIALAACSDADRAPTTPLSPAPSLDRGGRPRPDPVTVELTGCV